MQDDGVHRVRLLQLKQQLLHRLDGVVATQVDHHLLYLKYTVLIGLPHYQHMVMVNMFTQPNTYD